MTDELLLSGPKLVELRERARLTQEHVAVAAGITSARLRQLERKGGSVRTSTLGRLAAVYGVSPEDLLEWHGADGVRAVDTPSREDKSTLFALPEYAEAEARFVYRAIDELAKQKDAVYSQIPKVPRPYVGTTQVAVGGDAVVEFPPFSSEATLSIPAQDIIDGRADSLIQSLEQASDELLRTVMSRFYEYLSRLTHATGNVVDTKGKSLFAAFYEMLEKVELAFNDDGSVAGNYQLIVSPDVYERLAREEKTWTAEQRRALDALMNRKRKEFNDRRRRRRLS